MKTPDFTPSDFEPTAVETQALAWFGRREHGFTSDESVAFERWLESSQENRRVFDELAGTWRLLGEVPDWVIEADRADAMAQTRPRIDRRPLVAAVFLALAASVAALYIGIYRPTHFSGTFAAGIGEVQTATLPDGSTLRLNTDTSLSVHFTKGERRIKLEHGEALFTVAKNPSRPFFVEAGDVVVRAVGTAFDVRMNGKAVDVLVTEGKVRVDQLAGGGSVLPRAGLGDEPLLVAGHEAVVPAATKASPSAVTAVAGAEARRILAWENHQIEFVSAPLSVIIAEFNRYNHRQLVLGDPSLASREFGGSFRSDDSVGFVRMLTQNFSIHSRDEGDSTVLTLGR